MKLNNAKSPADARGAAQALLTLAGKSILVSGGASGLGAALCRTFADAGASVMIADIHRDRAQTVADAVGNPEARVQAIQCDVGDPVSAAQAVDETVRCFGRIDILINNAGTDVTSALEALTFQDWDRVIHTNLYGPFLLSKYALPHMKRGRRGHIVNIASTASTRAWPNASAYHASKWGLLGLSHALHAELRPHGIKVTAVIAGGMRTPFLLDRFPEIDPATLQDPLSVAKAVQAVLLLPDETVIPEIMVLPMRETSWP
jgi:NAD(P)-dependent dehydrogenase (short-subunit alcohol dehydrogenase family)